MQQTCLLCGRAFALKKYLSRHIQTVHGDKIHQCTKCNKFYRSIKTFREHNCPTVSDNDKEKFTCLICDKVFVKETYMKRHMKTHRNKNDATEDLVFICEICAKHFDTHRNLLRHRRMHSAQTVYSCDQCDRQFMRKDSLDSHLAVAHSHANEEVGIFLGQSIFQRSTHPEIK